MVSFDDYVITSLVAGVDSETLPMVIYAMALPERYDIASGVYAFALIVTMAASGEYPVGILFARAWETVVGGDVIDLGGGLVQAHGPDLFPV